MKKFNFYQAAILFAAIFFAVSCSDNDEIAVDPNATYDADLEVNEGGPASPNKDVTVDANTASTIKARVAFTTTTKDMKRLYITQNISGQGETVFKPTESVDLKGDGAIDLTGKNSKDFEFQFNLPVPSGVGTGTVVYKFWTTTGNGDFRDASQRLAIGPGTITLKYGSGTNPAADVKEFLNVKLSAPLANGTSSTFLSLLDGKVYTIKQGEEYVTFWDFGYYYLTSGNQASLGSTDAYPDAVVNIPTIANTSEDLNKAYFKLSTKTVTDFANVKISSDLGFVTKSDSQTITNLKANDVVEFVDQYGKKGLIKVLEVSGTDGSSGFIRIDVKAQP